MNILRLQARPGSDKYPDFCIHEQLAENSTRSNKYSYGWQRAEILGALINGVFLLALCFSIFLEAIQRMFEGPEVKSPQIVVIVGSLGLLSNIVGLFLFHEHGHGHSHGGHSHSHASKAEEGHSHAVTTFSAAKKGKNGHAAPNGNGQASERTPLLQGNSTTNTADFPALSSTQQQQQSQAAPRSLQIGGAETPFSDSANEYESGEDALDELLVHPARTREAIVRQAYDAGFGSPRNASGDGFSHRRTSSFQGSMSASKRGRSRTESTSFKNRERSASRGSAHAHIHEGHEHDHPHDEEDDHDDDEHDEHDHDHEHGEEDDHGHGGHSHGNMNMHGVFLHVLGDAVSGTLQYAPNHKLLTVSLLSGNFSLAMSVSSRRVSSSGSRSRLTASIRIPSFLSSLQSLFSQVLFL